MPMRRSPFGKMSGFVIVWEFRIHAAKRRAFERAYGPDGDWATFFRTGKGFLGTELIRDAEDPNRYLTLDFWKSRKHYERFKSQNQEMYQLIDQRCEAFTTKESEIGQFFRRSSKE
jgi:heme-degrading monooxygenase HmoA